MTQQELKGSEACQELHRVMEAMVQKPLPRLNQDTTLAEKRSKPSTGNSVIQVFLLTWSSAFCFVENSVLNGWVCVVGDRVQFVCWTLCGSKEQ